jgi:seryl-tRNA synthetase
MFVSLQATKFNPQTILLNADCQNVILLDHCKNTILLSTIEELQNRQREGFTLVQICESRAKMEKDAATATAGETESTDAPPAGDENATTGAAASAVQELEQWTTYMNNISTSLKTLEDPNMTVHLHDDTNALVKLSDMPRQSASETLSIRGTYSLVCYVEGQEEPTAVVDMCNIESPLETQKAAEVAAAELAATERKAAADAAAAQE